MGLYWENCENSVSTVLLVFRKIAKQLSDGIQEETKTEAATRQTAQDFEDACNEELSKFKPASRTTGTNFIFKIIRRSIFIGH